MTPTFSVLIGSAGRDTLAASLDSIARQARVDGDQVIVSFDAFEHNADWLAAQYARVAAYGPGFVARAYDAGYHWCGVEQINHAMRSTHLTGTHVLTIGDDDVFVDGAFTALRQRCKPNLHRPVLFRFVAPWRELLWEAPEMRKSRISGCCIAAPVADVRPMPTRQYVEHDFDWMQGILQHAAHTPDWWDRVLVIARPDARGADVTHQGVVQCWQCKDWRYLEDVDVIAAPTCPKCHVALDWPNRVLGVA